MLAVMPRIDCQHRGPVTADALMPILDTLGALALDEDVLVRAQAGELPSPPPTPNPASWFGPAVGCEAGACACAWCSTSLGSGGPRADWLQCNAMRAAGAVSIGARHGRPIRVIQRARL
jgi:hypothetical protein